MRSAGVGFWAPFGVLLLAGVLQSLAALFPWSIERLYARGFYPQMLKALSAFSRGFSFSVGEVILTTLLAAAVAGVVGLCVLLFARRGDRARLLKTCARFVVWVGAASLWAFLFAFGLNYQRPLLFELLGYEQRSADASELAALGEEIVRGVNESYDEAHAEGRMTLRADEVVGLLNESYASARELALLPRGDFAEPKPVYFSGLLTRLGISGVYFPFTGEPNYNAEAPDFQMPFALAHEMAHQRGVARESEANFVAYLVCVNSRDPFVRYSGYRGGLGVLAELNRVAPERAKELAARLGPGYREDSRRAALFWARAAGAAGALSQRFNDLYLRANRVRAGVKDYSGSTALIIGHYLRRKSHGDAAPAR
ncbi:MAG TPA: DUF3810 domain-containing protein [Pyrinomonadaceae bacterium]